MSKSKEELLEEGFVQPDTTVSNEDLEERKAKVRKMLLDAEQQILEQLANLRNM